MKLRWLGVVAVVVALVGGGTFALRSMADAGPAALSPAVVTSPTAPARNSLGPEPPFAIMRTDSGARVRGGTGTYCWHNVNEGICVDMIGHISNAEPIPLGLSEHYSIEFETTNPSSIQESWVLVDESESQLVNGGLVWMASHPPTTTRPTTTGRYVLTLFTKWPQGDASYGFYVELH